MMKRIGIGMLVFGVLLFMGPAAHAVPSLGLGGAYDATACGSATYYWQCFEGNSATGPGESFVVGPEMTVWSNIADHNIYLLAESSFGTVTVTGYTALANPTNYYSGKFTSYQGTPYTIFNLGDISGWGDAFNVGPFDTGQDDFRKLALSISFTASSPDYWDDWMFLVADLNDDGFLSQSDDHVTPRTTAAVSEPGTLLLLGSGLVGLGLYRRMSKA